MNECEYKAMKIEVYEIEEVLMNPTQRKNVPLIVRHDQLCKAIHSYELRRRSERVPEGVR